MTGVNNVTHDCLQVSGWTVRLVTDSSAPSMRSRFLWVVIAIATGLSLVYCVLRSSLYLSPVTGQGDRELCVAGRCDGQVTVSVKHSRHRLAGLAVDALDLNSTSSGSLVDVQKMLQQSQAAVLPACGNTGQDVLSAVLPSNSPTALDFLSNSKNPCWKETGTRESTPAELSCLPYFFLAGVSKCGSTDIFYRLIRHPQVVPPTQKEPCWFDKKFSSEKYPFQWYISNFAQASSQISHDLQSVGTSKKVVGDGSPTYFWRNFHWQDFGGNEGCVEPRVVIPDAIHHLVPEAKIIFSFRNPVDSIYSKYLAQADKGMFRSPQHFHSLVESGVARYQHCFARFSLRRCAYNLTLTWGTELRLEKGLYAIFLADWFRVFPRQQIHILRFEDYITDIAGHLRRTFEFLDLDAMSKEAMDDVAALPPSNRGQHYNVGPMLPATRRLLVRFYAPFNSRLADVLGDKRFLWSSP